MAAPSKKLITAVEAYLADLHRVRASGGATGERSYYPALANLIGAVGRTLKPRVFCVLEGADQGAGHPDYALYTAKQVQPKDLAWLLASYARDGLSRLEAAGNPASLAALPERDRGQIVMCALRSATAKLTGGSPDCHAPSSFRTVVRSLPPSGRVRPTD